MQHRRGHKNSAAEFFPVVVVSGLQDASLLSDKTFVPACVCRPRGFTHNHPSLTSFSTTSSRQMFVPCYCYCEIRPTLVREPLPNYCSTESINGTRERQSPRPIFNKECRVLKKGLLMAQKNYQSWLYALVVSIDILRLVWQWLSTLTSAGAFRCTHVFIFSWFGSAWRFSSQEKYWFVSFIFSFGLGALVKVISGV